MDATACYDRHIKSVGVLALLCFGLDAIGAKWFLHFLDSVRYKITINGRVSEETYVGDTSNQGVGQGSTGAGGTWTTTDTLITEKYKLNSFPALLASRTKHIVVEKGSAAFVDDRTLYVNRGSENEIRKKLAHNVTTIQRLLGATGGAINMNKSSYSIITYHEESVVDSGNDIMISRPECERKAILSAGERYLTQETALTQHNLEREMGIAMPNFETANEKKAFIEQTAERVPLKRTYTSTPIKSLGFWYQANGATDHIESIIKKRNERFVKDMLTAMLEPRLILKAYECKHLPAINYMLHGTNPSREFLIHQSSDVTSSLLPKLGMNRHTPISVRHCPTERLGFGLPHLFCDAVIIQVKQWLKHVRRGGNIGEQLIINLCWAQLSIGISRSILQDVSTNLPYLPIGRKMWLREFLYHIGGEIQCEYVTLPPRNCVNDLSIMDVITKENLSDTNLKKVNKTR